MAVISESRQIGESVLGCVAKAPPSGLLCEQLVTLGQSREEG